MEMETHQKLDSPIDIRCCTQIQLAVPSRTNFELSNPPRLRLTEIRRDQSGFPSGTVARG
jgi:hypothetical protein